MAKQEIVYRDINGAMRNAEFDSFDQAMPLIDKLDRQNASYDWYECVNGRWVDASEVRVMQDPDNLAGYIAA
jgi:hypothetical protein